MDAQLEQAVVKRPITGVCLHFGSGSGGRRLGRTEDPCTEGRHILRHENQHVTADLRRQAIPGVVDQPGGDSPPIGSAARARRRRAPSPAD